MTTIVMATGAGGRAGVERCAEALQAAGVNVHTFAPSRTSYRDAIGAAGSPVVLWGTGDDGAQALQVAAEGGGVTGVIAVAPILDGASISIETLRKSAAAGGLGELVRLARAHSAARYAPAPGCPLLIQVADEDPERVVRSAMRAAWNAGADVRHYPCATDELFEQRFRERLIEHELVFLRQRLGRR